MKKFSPITTLAVAIFALGTLFSACSPRNRIVENPYIETANGISRDIVRVELSDTATIVHLRAYQTPKYWVKTSSDSYLRVGEERYPVISSIGAALDEEVYAPASGVVDFKLICAPLPKGTKSFDFISPKGSCIYGVDLTARAKPHKYHPELPQELRRELKDGPLPEVSYEVGISTVNIHIMGWREEMGEEVDLTVNHLLTSQERVAMNFDRQSRTASAQFMQYGTAFCYVNFSGKFGRVWLEPGATTDVYLDMSHTGLRLMAKREGKVEPTCYDNGLYATGKYGDISRARSALTMAYMMRVKYDYQEPTEKWIERNLTDYLHRVDSLDKMPDRHPLHKKISRLELDESFIGAIISYDLEVRSDMIIKNHDTLPREQWESIPTPKMSAEQYRLLMQYVDMDNPALWLREMTYAGFYAHRTMTDVLPADHPIMENAMSSEYFLKARNLQLTDEDFRVLSGFKHKGYEKAMRSVQAAQQLKLDIAAGKTNVKTAPNVPADKVFQAILDRYRGKVVLVDFWGLGCTGCVLDSEEWLEPMKKGFDGEDVVWLNIADERNDIVPYTIEIAKIQGEHYRLTRKQWEAIEKQHGFNFIPCYFLVGKDGTYRMINNLRGTTGFERAIREELAK